MNNRPSFIFAKLLIRKLETGEYVGTSNGTMVAIKFKSKKKSVNFITNLLDLPCTPVQSKHKWKFLEFYNKHRNHVDIPDMHIAAYRWRHKNLKWTSAALVGLIEFTLYNTWVIFKKFKSEELSYKQFLINLQHAIIDEYCIAKPMRVPCGAHGIYWAWDESGAQHRRCKGNQCQKRTDHFCTACEIPLCKQCYVAHLPIKHPLHQQSTTINQNN